MSTQVIDVVPTGYSGTPALVYGDAEFWGPPNFQARFWLTNELGEIVYLHGSMRWEEPKRDYTTFQLDMNMVLFDVRSQLGYDWYFVGFKGIYDLLLPEQQIPGIDEGLQVLYQSNEGVIASVRAEGDSYGGWFGGPDRPRVELDFNRVYFEVSNDPRPGLQRQNLSVVGVASTQKPMLRKPRVAPAAMLKAAT